MYDNVNLENIAQNQNAQNPKYSPKSGLWNMQDKKKKKDMIPKHSNSSSINQNKAQGSKV
jgi:hypothetical protein